MLVPSPISAWGATSAVGWMRTDGRSFMRSPAVGRILPCPPDGLASSSSCRGRERANGLARRRDRFAPMAHKILLLGRELGRGQARWELEDRVVAEATLPAALRCHRAFDRAIEDLHRRAIGTRICKREPADHARATIADSLEPVDQD